MRTNLAPIRTYITIGVTFGAILAVPGWQAALTGQQMPHNWPETQRLAVPLMLATGHGVLRMYTWLPSAVYHLGFAHVTFQHWLFDGW